MAEKVSGAESRCGDIAVPKLRNNKKGSGEKGTDEKSIGEGRKTAAKSSDRQSRVSNKCCQKKRRKWGGKNKVTGKRRGRGLGRCEGTCTSVQEGMDGHTEDGGAEKEKFIRERGRMKHYKRGGDGVLQDKKNRQQKGTMKKDNAAWDSDGTSLIGGAETGRKKERSVIGGPRATGSWEKSERGYRQGEKVESFYGPPKGIGGTHGGELSREGE